MKECSVYYQAIVERNAKYDGVFYFGLATTGVFCKPSCPARCPNQSNCAYFKAPEEAIRLGYRPCLRCKPLSPSGAMPKVMRDLLLDVNENPEYRWSELDLKKRSIDPSTARRQFKKYMGITFLAYARLKRLERGLAYQEQGHSMVDAQMMSGYQSRSGFRSACKKMRDQCGENA